MTQDLPPPAGPEPGAHRAPPVDTRPRSTLAVVALVIAIVSSVLTIVLGFVWVLLLPAFVLGIWALVKIKPQISRGQGMAIWALLLSFAMGSCSLIAVTKMQSAVTDAGRGVMASAASGDEAKLSPWFQQAAIDAGAPADVLGRFANIQATYGKYLGEVECGSLMLGLSSIFLPPDATEVPSDPAGEKGKTARAWPQGSVAWIRATFEKTTLHVGLVIGEGESDGMRQFIEGLGETGPKPVLLDVRFFLSD